MALLRSSQKNEITKYKSEKIVKHRLLLFTFSIFNFNDSSQFFLSHVQFFRAHLFGGVRSRASFTSLMTPLAGPQTIFRDSFTSKSLRNPNQHRPTRVWLTGKSLCKLQVTSVIFFATSRYLCWAAIIRRKEKKNLFDFQFNISRRSREELNNMSNDKRKHFSLSCTSRTRTFLFDFQFHLDWQKSTKKIKFIILGLIHETW